MLINSVLPRLAVPLGSMRFYPPTAGDDDYARLNVTPTNFGSGEFTFGMLIRLNGTDQTAGTGVGNWHTTTTAPQAGGADGWFDGNFLLDGHNNPDRSLGTCSLQLVNGGDDIRWTFGDGAAAAGKTWGLHACQSSGADLNDTAWHWIECVRRNDGGSGSILELYVDNVEADTDTSTARTNMYTTYWDDFAGFDQPYWAFGAEKISAEGGTPWEKFAGDVTEICFWNRAKTVGQLTSSADADRFGTTNLLARYRCHQPMGTRIGDHMNLSSPITLVPQSSAPWTTARP